MRSISWGWKVPVLCALEPSSHTFGELWSMLPGITPKLLSDTLRDLEAAALIAQAHGARKDEIRYVLTETGQASLPHVQSILGQMVSEVANRATPEQFLALQMLFTGVATHARVRRTTDAIRDAADEIRRLITSGAFRPGERLPSARQTARMMSLTVSQATLVYERLKAEGMVTTRRRAGTFVPTREEAEETPVRYLSKAS